MSIYESGVIVVLAAIIHAHLQVSVSMLTLMSGHALGKKTRHTRLLNLMSGFILGSIVMTACLVSLSALFIQNITPSGTPLILWSVVCGLLVGVGMAIWALYYKLRAHGTVLWLPRPMAHHLAARAEATKSPVEAFGLGMIGIFAELLFSFAPMLIAALFLARIDAPLQLAGLVIYTLIATAPLVVILMMVGGGHSLGKIQHWRERNKRFLQFTAGGAMIVLGAYLYADIILIQAQTAGVQ